MSAQFIESFKQVGEQRENVRFCWAFYRFLAMGLMNLIMYWEPKY